VTHERLERFRRSLLAQRASLLGSWRQAISDENEQLEAGVGTAMVMDCITAQARGALAHIQSSLARIERGTYEECVACRGRIDEDRLRAAPDSDRCRACAPLLS
jgi:RNA polymerase-binding transcription factor DksA